MKIQYNSIEVYIYQLKTKTNRIHKKKELFKIVFFTTDFTKVY